MLFLSSYAFVISNLLMLLPHHAFLYPTSPCPQIFYYERVKPSGDILFPGRDNYQWKGVVHISGQEVNSGGAFHLTVLLAVSAALPNKYVGRIEFLGDREKLVEGNLSHISYDVRFPSGAPLPNLLQIRINDRVLCNGIPPRSTVVTKLILEHSIFPLRVNISSRRNDGSLEKSFNYELNMKCGGPSLNNPLVVTGRPSNIGDWPWLVPLFHLSENGLQFLCGGTLISDQYIISAAHCFTEIEESDLIVYVGRRNIRNWMENLSQPRAVKSIIIHPDFNQDTLYSDLALLHLSTPVLWSKAVNPVCLWSGSSSLSQIVGKIGTVVGWGTDDVEKAKITSEPRVADLPIVSQEECLRSNRDFYYFTSNRTLCAGARDGTGPCNGDSGGGFYLPMKDSDGQLRWFLRGIVSLSLIDLQTRNCNLYQYLVFTDVAQFWPWINKNINKAK